MTTIVGIALIALGLAVTALNWSSIFLSKPDRFVSAVPLIGGFLLVLGFGTLPSLRSYAPYIWLIDYGTLIIICPLPGLIREMWRYSRWNVAHEFRAQSGNIGVVLYKHGVATVSLDEITRVSDEPACTGFSSRWCVDGDCFLVAPTKWSGTIRICSTDGGFILNESDDTAGSLGRDLLPSVTVSKRR